MHKTFWTCSVWEDRSSLELFAGSEPHRRIIERLRPRMSPTRFEFFETRGASLPTIWPERKSLLAERDG